MNHIGFLRFKNFPDRHSGNLIEQELTRNDATRIGDVAIYEDRSRPNYLMEVFRFKDEVEFTAFDDKFHKDRKIAAIYALLDDIVEAEKSDFKIFERRL